MERDVTKQVSVGLCFNVNLAKCFFYQWRCLPDTRVLAEASDVTGINLSQERTEEEIQRDIKHQEDEEENCKWTQAPTLLLISEYKERQERIDTGRLKKKRAFEEIAEVLKQNMYPFTDVQCASRMKTLIRQYKTVKDNNNTSGSKRKSFLYENELDSLFKDSPNIRPQFVMSSGTISGAADDASDESSDEIVPKTQKRKMENCADEKDEDLCKICMDKMVNTVFTDCGHMVCCTACCELLSICPICRKESTKWIKVFKA